jgi:hypothetical protein
MRLLEVLCIVEDETAWRNLPVGAAQVTQCDVLLRFSVFLGRLAYWTKVQFTEASQTARILPSFSVFGGRAALPERG